MIAESLKHLCLAEWREDHGHPCVLERWHDEPYHRDAEGYEWRAPVTASFVPEPVPPPVRKADGGYVLEAAHPGAGEMDWKAEVLAIDAVLGNRSAFDDCATRAEKVEKAVAQASEGWRLQLQHRWLKRERDDLTEERDALRAEAERLKVRIEEGRGWGGTNLLAKEAAELEAILTGANAPQTAINAPPARNDAPDVAGEGPAPVEVQGGAR